MIMRNLSVAKKATFGASILVPLALQACLATWSGMASAQDPARAVLTQHNDNARTGAYLSEHTLTPASVASRGMRLKFTRPTAGIEAQPLYVPAVRTGNGLHDVVYVATRADTVYAFDANGATVPGTPAGSLWMRRLHDGEDVTGRPSARPVTWGVGSTPVIDLPTNTMYVVYGTANKPRQGPGEDPDLDVAYWLAALDIRTGTVLRSTKVTGSVQTGGGSTQFLARNQWNRPGLLLSQGVLYIAFGPRWREEQIEYHGWILGYDAQSFAQKGTFCTTPRWRGNSQAQHYSQGEGAGIWQGGGGLAADGAGNVFCLTANGDAAPGSYGNSALRLTPAADRNGLDTFRVSSFDAMLDDPAHERSYKTNDLDLGSGGPLLMADDTRLVGGGKTGILYLIDSARMTRLQKLEQAFTAHGWGGGRYATWDGGPHLHGAPVGWQGADQNTYFVYAWAEKDSLKRFTYRRATDRFDAQPLVETSVVAPFRSGPADPVTMPGGMLSLSANGRRDGIIWASLPNALLPDGSDNGGRLLAFDAGSLHELWEGSMPSTHFMPPTVADGKVIVGTTSGQLLVYELR